jgi:phytoene dehydrogenase-like protein
MLERCGYQVEVLERHDTAGGLATSWRRGDYTFETCLHWLLGSNPDSAMYSRWREVFDIGKLTFVNPEEFVRLKTEHGECLSIYTDLGSSRIGTTGESTAGRTGDWPLRVSCAQARRA